MANEFDMSRLRELSGAVGIYVSTNGAFAVPNERPCSATQEAGISRDNNIDMDMDMDMGMDMVHDGP